MVWSEKLKAHLGLLGTNFFFATNYSAIKYLIGKNEGGPFAINLVRIGVSLVLFWSLPLFGKREPSLKRRDLPRLLLCAAAAIGLNQMLFIKGLSLTYSIHAALLTLMTPILITVLAARILKENLTYQKMAGLILGASGAILLVSMRAQGHAGENAMEGDLLVLLSAVAYTFYFILVKPLMNTYSAATVMRWVFTFGFFLVLPVSYGEFLAVNWSLYSLKDWGLLGLVTIPGTFLAYLFNAYGIQKLSASVAGAYIYSQPVFAVVIAMGFLGEELSLVRVVAALLIFGGVFLSNTRVVPPKLPQR
ncbi:MAG: EamA family transporter [Bacteroidota bacterium]|nr:EamA family transporter [Bacteroidota bacterium]